MGTDALKWMPEGFNRVRRSDRLVKLAVRRPKNCEMSCQNAEVIPVTQPGRKEVMGNCYDRPSDPQHQSLRRP